MASTTTGAPPLPKSSGTNIANANANAPNPCMPGRVLRLHFECRASLLIGSTLHVTASSLWAPGSTAVAELIHDTNNSNNHNNSKDDANDNTKSATAFGSSKHNQNGTDNNNTTTEGSSSSSLYVSSVAMVTTPDTYPVWKTRTPVVVVLNRHAASKHRVQHFYYRYLVVSPGATTTTTTVAQQQQQLMVGSSSSEQPGAAKDGNLSSPMVLTSSSTSGGGSTPVSQWEDPFVGTNNTHLNLFIAPNINNSTEVSSSATTTYARTSVGGGDEEPITANMSTVSLASTVASTYYPSASSTTMDNMNMTTHLHTLADYFNLPYRTLDIDPHHLIPGSTSSSSTTTGATAPGADQDGTTTSTAAEYRPFATDNWNGADDATFQPYLIREAINAENRRKVVPKVEGTTTAPHGSSAKSHSNAATATAEGMEELPPRPPKAHSTSGQATPPSFSVHNRIFFVCFHLPVVVVQNQTTGQWQASWSESILAKTEGSQILSTYQAYWVGTVTTHPPLQTKEDVETVRSLLDDMKCIPIFLDATMRQSHYYGFCKQVLWPAFHNIDLLDLSTCGWLSDPKSVASDWDQSRLEDWWQAYITVNQEFSDIMKNLLRAGDIIWIHDYHLTLLPQQLTKWEMEKFGNKVTRKVFFLHIPFPTSQIFRELNCGEQILKGMLHADVVGFHAFDHARHFLNAAKRILGLSYESLVGGLIGVSFQGSTVLVSMSNVSIEPRMVDAALTLPSVQTERNELKRKHFGRSIIGGVDVGQRLSGASLKLLAYERLLQDYPNWQHHVVMVQRLLLPGSRKADEALTTREVRILVKRIQDKFGTAVIDYQEVVGDSLPMDQRLALWKASDILMSTPIREGLNHWPMEFIYCHKEPESPGIVITSEFSAVSSILNGALRVNPYDIQETITTIDKALGMVAPEREGRRYRDMFFVSNSPSDKWVKNVLRDLRDAIAASTASGSESTSQISTPYGTPYPSSKLSREEDSTAAFLAREASLAFEHLHLRDLKRAYDVSTRRVIILDFNGTIVLKEPPGKYLKREILGTSGNKPPPHVINALTVLCANQNNTVYVVSGDSSENVLTAIGHVPGLGLAVSNGACFSPPVQNPESDMRRWLTFDLGVDWDAVKRVALPVLSKYTARSNGSFVKLTSFSIGWSYYSCDPEWGSLQATHLVMELENELRSFDVRFVTLKGIVEVVPRKLNKGLIVKKVLLDTASAGTGVDFVLCCGDDISDEKMFTSVLTFVAELGDEQAKTTSWVPPVIADSGEFVDQSTGQVSSIVPDPMYAFTVAVGKKVTHATTYLNDAQEVANALVMLAGRQVPEGGVPIWGSENATEMFG